MKRRLAGLAGLTLAGSFMMLASLRSDAVNTRTSVLDSQADLAAGSLDRTSVTSDGQVVVGVDLQRVALDPSGASVWCMLENSDGSALIGTGIDGKVFKVENGRATLYAETGAVVVTTLARAPDGTVYAGTLPDGKIFKLVPPQNGRPQTPTVLATLPETEHIWGLVWDAGRNALIAATGPQGKLFAVDRAGNASVIFDSEEPQLYSLALGPDGVIYTGAGGGHAILYAVRGPGRANALARFAGDEVKSIIATGTAQNTELFVAANEFGEPPEPPRRGPPARTPSLGASSRQRAGKGSVYRVRSNGTVERLYNNTDSQVMALARDNDRADEVLAALGVGGRVVGIAMDRTSRVVMDVDEQQVLSLAFGSKLRAFGTGDSGAVYLVTSSRPTDAAWTSKVMDGGTLARWGALRWRGSGNLVWKSRSGNSDTPDATWSDWQDLENGRIRSNPSRYLQVRAEWSRDPNAVIRAVTAYYLPTNQRAVLTDLTAEPKTGDPRPLAIKITWKVDNPDNDPVRYRLRFRAENEANNAWRPMLRGSEFLTTTTYDWSVEGLPEGYYRVQLEASDEAANPENETERDIKISEPVLIDNTPPRVTVTVANGRLRGEAVDGASAVTRVEFAVDTQDWRAVRGTDGVLDELTEGFESALPVITDNNPHTLAVRAYDEAGNVGTANAVFRGPITAPRTP